MDFYNVKKIVKTLIFSIGLFFSVSASAQTWDRSQIQEFKTFDSFEHLLHLESDTTYLINFWATWCGPCVKELPYIDEQVSVFENDKFKSILVSLDFEKQIDSRLIPFLNKNKLKSEIALLLDGKASKWIDRVDPSWSGAIPITIIYNKNKRQFLERQFHSTEELTDIIKPFLIN